MCTATAVRVCDGFGTSRPFHGDKWLFSSVLLFSYEKADLAIGRLYEAIKNVCQSTVSNAIPKWGRDWGWGGGAGMVKRPFTVTLKSSLTALLFSFLIFHLFFNRLH